MKELWAIPAAVLQGIRQTLMILFSQPLVWIGIIGVLVWFIIANHLYKQTTYYRITHKFFLRMLFDVGAHGEYLIYKRLRSHEANGAKFLFNVYLPKEEDQTTEIDVLMLCKEGIFVFESKNYSGWIFGSEAQYKWTQVLPQGRGRSKKEYFYNPIHQNDTHIRWLKVFLNTPFPIHSMIVFSERCTLKDISVNRSDVRVFNRYDIETEVQARCREVLPEQYINNADLQCLYEQLYPFTQVSDKAKQKHIEDFQTPQKTEDKLQEPRCPKCGGKLVKRTAKRGANSGNTFYGCENFPKCRYIQNLDDKQKE